MAIDATENSNYKNPEVAHKLNSIQFCRAIAFLSVLMLHRVPSWDFFYIFQYGKYGVMMFFIISGFIITFLNLNGKTESLKTFLLKRFIRIYPVYWLSTLVCVIVSVYNYYTGFTDWTPTLSLYVTEWIPTIMLLPTNNGLTINNVAWSLIYEIWYYLLFAFLIFHLKNKFIIGVFGYSYLIIIINTFFPSLLASRAFYVYWGIMFSTLNLFFIMGACIAYILFERDKKHIILCVMTFLCSAGFQVLFGYKKTLGEIGGVTTEILMLSLSLFIIIGTIYLEINKGLKFPSFFVYVGNMSYTLYLFHYVWVEIYRGIYGKLFPSVYKYSGMEIASYYFTLIIICSVIYKYFELPSNYFLRKKLIKNRLIK
ncbi:TPA: acyltransferase family protein [Yersinia enterocolitica]